MWTLGLENQDTFGWSQGVLNTQVSLYTFVLFSCNITQALMHVFMVVV